MNNPLHDILERLETAEKRITELEQQQERMKRDFRRELEEFKRQQSRG